jgi:hypothetical protein
MTSSYNLTLLIPSSQLRLNFIRNVEMSLVDLDFCPTLEN